MSNLEKVLSEVMLNTKHIKSDSEDDLFDTVDSVSSESQTLLHVGDDPPEHISHVLKNERIDWSA